MSTIPDRPQNDPQPCWDGRDVVAVAVLALIWLVGACLINPIGEFPLNDDWAYVLPVKEMVERGRLVFTDWQAMPLLTQVGYGTLACVPGGYSITTLRIVTLVIGFFGVFGVYFIGRLMGRREIALWAALVLMSNPLYWLTSSTFLVDVPFATFTLWSLALLWLGVMHGGNRWLAAGVGLALLATFTRQLGIFIMPSAAVLLFLHEGFSRRFWLWGVTPSIVLVAALIGYQEALKAADMLPHGIAESTDSTGRLLRDLSSLQLGALKPGVTKAALFLMYAGLSIGALILLSVAARWNVADATNRGRQLIGLVICLGGLAAVAFGLGISVPWKQDPLWGLGFGPMTLANWSPPAASQVAAVVLTVLGVLLGSLLAWLLLDTGIRAIRSRTWPAPVIGLAAIVIALTYMAPTLISYSMWSERYTIWITPLVLVAVLGLTPPGPVSGVWRGLLGAQVRTGVGFGIAATHDYIEWNRVRWQVGRQLLDGGTSLESLDGGFEFNAYQAALADGVWKAWQQPREDATVLLAASAPDATRTIAAARCRWLPGSVGEILVITK